MSTKETIATAATDQQISAKLPTAHVSSVEGDEAVAAIEEDSEVHIQK